MSWNLYQWMQPTIDCEPELMVKNITLHEAVKWVKNQFIICHKQCPKECVPLKSVPKNVDYDVKYAYDKKGAFFKLPNNPDQHRIINIAAIYELGTCEYYVIKADNTKQIEKESQSNQNQEEKESQSNQNQEEKESQSNQKE